MDKLLDHLIAQLNSSVFVLLAILFVAGWALYKMGSWKEIFNHHAGRIGNVESIKDTVIELKTKIDLIYQFTNPNAVVKAQSPISLTPIGKQIVESIKAEDVQAPPLKQRGA